MGFVRIEDDYPWDSLAPYLTRARAHPDGLVDLSIGTPVDPTPEPIRAALAAAADAPGYPTVAGTADLREAIADWFGRRRRTALGVESVLPTVGSKELVGLLPSLLGLGPDDVVVFPSAAYPTYEVGARLAGTRVLAADDVADWADVPGVKLVWVNSPGNPTGAVASVETLREVVAAARAVGAVVASDECYAELPWTEPWITDGVPCLLEDAVSGGDLTGLLSVYSLSKQSNLAGYRAALVAGDPALVADLTRLRRHLGMIMPAPVQAAMAVALRDEAHVTAQREVYRRRRDVLAGALTAAGFRIDHSEAGLYLWVRRVSDADCWATLDALADLGIVAGPGAFYGSAANGHVRIALTASDERIDAAAARLATLG